jgi:hypothetical protein
MLFIRAGKLVFCGGLTLVDKPGFHEAWGGQDAATYTGRAEVRLRTLLH